MSEPSVEEYSAPDFDPSTLKVSQLRTILINHGLQLYTVVKKPDLIKLFEDTVRPKSSDHPPEAEGASVSVEGVAFIPEVGDEMHPEPPTEKRRGRSIDATADGNSPEPEMGPPAKRLRGASHTSLEGNEDNMGNDSATSILGPMGPPPKRKPGRPKKNASLDAAPATAAEMEEELNMPESSGSRQMTQDLDRGADSAAPASEAASKDAKNGKKRSKGESSEDAAHVDTEAEAARKEEARKRRISGWADWLKKKAKEQTRTREEWQEFANKRRRGKAWMEGMMQEYGVAAYTGGPAEPYISPLTDIPPTGQPKRRGPPPGTPRAPRAPKPEEPAGPRVFDPLIDAPTDPSMTGETDAERALRSIYPDFAHASEIPNISGYPHRPKAGPSNPHPPPAADGFEQVVDFDAIFDESSVDYFETTQRYGPGRAARASRQMGQQSHARTESTPYTLAQVQEAADAEEAKEAEDTDAAVEHNADEEVERLRQKAMAIVSSIQPQNPS